MNRRDFLALVGAAAAFPRLAFAQAKVPRIAFLSIPVNPTLMDALRQGLADHGYVDGKTMTFTQFTAPTNDDLPAAASKAIASNPDVIITAASPAALILKSLTSTVPIVFASSGDPVELGLVASLAHPGGNVTGLTSEGTDFAAKRVAIIKQMIPTARRLCALNVPADTEVVLATAATFRAANAVGIGAVIVDFIEGQDFESQFAPVAAAGVHAVIVSPSAYFSANRDALHTLELKTKLPLLWSEGVADPFTGVLGYGSNISAQYRRAGAVVDAILKGAKPADLAVEQPATVDFGVNLATAGAIGLTIPPSVLAQATTVIQ